MAVGGVEVEPGGQAGGVGGVEEVCGRVPCLPDLAGDAWRGDGGGFRGRETGGGGG